MNLMEKEKRLEELHVLLGFITDVNPTRIKNAMTLVSELKAEARRDVIRNKWREEELEEKERLRNERLEKQDKQRTLDIERDRKLYGKGGTYE
tara:strand:- start:166 stop:444 length:279 start_codon:yes stop_codon:yes gene_type:complete